LLSSSMPSTTPTPTLLQALLRGELSALPPPSFFFLAQHLCVCARVCVCVLFKDCQPPTIDARFCSFSRPCAFQLACTLLTLLTLFTSTFLFSFGERGGFSRRLTCSTS
jgi:hypothetical protein